MIVKNESHVIERCLASVRDIISSWIIVDTGSTDGTQEKIRAYLNDIPGELYQKQWVNFAHNRTEALQFIPEEAEYILIIDADEELCFENEVDLTGLIEDGYYIQTRLSGLNYYRLQLVKNGLGWRWESKLHEYIISDISRPPAVLQGIYNLPHPDGFRSSNPNKYKQDALTLEQAILEEPDNSRYFFYLAQSYRDCRDIDLAIRYYTRRIQMGGWREEVWYALYQIGLLKLQRGDAWESVQMAFFDAFNYRPSRVEPLIPVIEYYRKLGAWPLANFFAAQAVDIPYPDDILFIEAEAYSSRLWLEYAYILNGLGDYGKAIAVCNAICHNANPTSEIRQQALFIRATALDAAHPVFNAPEFSSKKIKVLIKVIAPDLLFDNCLASILSQSIHADEIYCVTSSGEPDRIYEYIGDLPVTVVEEDELSTAMKIQNDDLVLFLESNSWLLYCHSLSKMRDELVSRNAKILYGQHMSESGLHGKLNPQSSTGFLKYRTPERQNYAWCMIRGECLPVALESNIVNNKSVSLEKYLIPKYPAYFIETSQVAVQSSLPEEISSDIPLTKQIINN